MSTSVLGLMKEGAQSPAIAFLILAVITGISLSRIEKKEE